MLPVAHLLPQSGSPMARRQAAVVHSISALGVGLLIGGVLGYAFMSTAHTVSAQVRHLRCLLAAGSRPACLSGACLPARSQHSTQAALCLTGHVPLCSAAVAPGCLSLCKGLKATQRISQPSASAWLLGGACLTACWSPLKAAEQCLHKPTSRHTLEPLYAGAADGGRAAEGSR